MPLKSITPHVAYLRFSGSSPCGLWAHLVPLNLKRRRENSHSKLLANIASNNLNQLHLLSIMHFSSINLYLQISPSDSVQLISYTNSSYLTKQYTFPNIQHGQHTMNHASLSFSNQYSRPFSTMQYSQNNLNTAFSPFSTQSFIIKLFYLGLILTFLTIVPFSVTRSLEMKCLNLGIKISLNLYTQLNRLTRLYSSLSSLNYS